jgi:hypothetical protein
MRRSKNVQAVGEVARIGGLIGAVIPCHELWLDDASSSFSSSSLLALAEEVRPSVRAQPLWAHCVVAHSQCSVPTTGCTKRVCERGTYMRVALHVRTVRA